MYFDVGKQENVSNSNIDFSIVMPVFNGNDYINETLIDIIKILPENGVELLIVDDGSSDSTWEKILNFSKENNFIRSFKQEHKGVSAARNLGIKNARGDYILFLDSDDGFHSNVFDVLKSNIAKFKSDILIFGATVHNYNPKWRIKDIVPNNRTYEQFDSKILFEEPGVRPFVWTTAYKRTFLIDNNLAFDESVDVGEDNLFQFTVLPLAKKIQLISDKLYIYNYLKYNSSISEYVANVKKRIDKHIYLVAKIIEALKNNGYYDLCKNELCKWIVDLLFNDYKQLSALEQKQVRKSFKNIITKNNIKFKTIRVKITYKVKLKCMLNGFLYGIYKIIKKH